MAIELKTGKKLLENTSAILLLSGELKNNSLYPGIPDLNYINEYLFIKKKKSLFIPGSGTSLTIINTKELNNEEAYRKAGAEAFALQSAAENESVQIIADPRSLKSVYSFTEGFLLASYQFLKYKTGDSSKPHCLKSLSLINNLNVKEIKELDIVCEAVFKARDLVNEPVMFLTAVQLSKEIEKMAKEGGFEVEVFNKSKIESLKMGGLLAVNRGSQDPPTFSILSYKGKAGKKSKPIVLVGKGVVYDTGGLSLKPTPNSMDQMKSDMAGAAAVAATIYAIAKAKLPVHVIGLIPATDNRPGEKAYTPGDVITMHSGTTVEVLNTDAEGRMILADALSYAKQYEPELVIDLATLTGAAIVAVGNIATAAMTNSSSSLQKLKKTGDSVHERLVELPLWEEYKEMIKSDIADLKNIGGAGAGSITAGKFLEHFTDYPWIHLDIAGPSFLTTKDSYRGKGGTGVGVRLLYHYLKNL